MKWFEFPFAILAVLLVAALVPPWMWFIDQHIGELGIAARFLAQLALPATLLLFLASWVDPVGG